MATHPTSLSFNMLFLNGICVDPQIFRGPFKPAKNQNNLYKISEEGAELNIVLNSNKQLYITNKWVKTLISHWCHFAIRRITFQIQDMCHFLRNTFLWLFERKKWIVNLSLEHVSPAHQITEEDYWNSYCLALSKR